MTDTPRRRPDVAGHVAELSRKAALGRHVNQTMEAGLQILQGPSTAETAWKVVDLLTKAAPRYTRLGGASPYWPDGVSRRGHRTGTGAQQR